ncbi:hypothetical protein RF55_10505 [Lasius niger]|uniref:Uncharacterized protein n=1 Tax=Lasius niger TaxID=67767 RepID=A0A0J7NB39_LASNI|nr:hypothetical protein RF55_10505 [Lasius niger]
MFRRNICTDSVRKNVSACIFHSTDNRFLAMAIADKRLITFRSFGKEEIATCAIASKIPCQRNKVFVGSTATSKDNGIIGQWCARKEIRKAFSHICAASSFKDKNTCRAVIRKPACCHSG